MSNGSKAYRVYFPIATNEKWLGGVNYYKNLFQAINSSGGDIEIYIPKDNPDVLFQYAKQFEINKKQDFYYYLIKTIKKMLGKGFDKNSFFLKRSLKQFDLISHTNTLVSEVPTITWIPDFQHIYLKDMFSDEEKKIRDEVFLNYAKNSSCVILSSQDAKNDFEKLYPQYKHKAQVLNFVSYIPPDIYEAIQLNENEIQNKFNLPKKYFYIPNQFWQHKNHITAFKALKLLKDKGIEINLLCSGYTQDYRNKDYFDLVLMKYINENGLNENIRFLGVIKLNEVYYLMRNCVSIINPSLFEGWSSTVEEAKSLGKNIILSDLNVHIEQKPPQGKYFERNNPEQLAKIMEEDWNNLSGGPNFELEKLARENMDKRMKEFGKNYCLIVENLLKNKEAKHG